MLKRCYEKTYQERNQSYADCFVCDDWLTFSNFKIWFDDNYPYELTNKYNLTFCLDKDLLIENNKIYSPDTCIFIPHHVNSFLSTKYKNNKSGYTGVSWCKTCNKWQATIRDFQLKKQKHLGFFEDILDARDAYISERILEANKVKGYMRLLGYGDDIVERIK